MTMSWLPLALLCAFSLATSDALTKRALARHPADHLVCLRLLLAAPVFLLALWFAPRTAPGPGFWRAFLTALPLEAVASVLYVRALRESPLSLTLPLLALTPVFLLAVPFLLLGERLTTAGICGVLLIAAGAYLLNGGRARSGLLEPLRSLVRERGARYMCLVAFIYSITSTLGKQAVSASSPVFFAALYFPALGVVLTPLALRRRGGPPVRLFAADAVRAAFWPAMFYALMVLCHMTAIGMTRVAYLISVKRLSLLMGVVYGIVLFGEDGATCRLAGAVLMVGGVILLTLSA